MSIDWSSVASSVLRPQRPNLGACLAAKDEHLERVRAASSVRAAALVACERRIDEARHRVFDAKDGVVGASMTSLEREWRKLARVDSDAGLMDYWARVAPASWVDRKRWRYAPVATRLDVATMLAAGAEGVEEAEAAVADLRSAMARCGRAVAESVRYRPFENDVSVVVELLAETRAAAEEACPPRFRERLVARALEVEGRVRATVVERLPERACLARDIGHAAYVEVLALASARDSLAAPVRALGALWRTGYVLSALDAGAVTLEVPLEA